MTSDVAATSSKVPAGVGWLDRNGDFVSRRPADLVENRLASHQHFFRRTGYECQLKLPESLSVPLSAGTGNSLYPTEKLWFSGPVEIR